MNKNIFKKTIFFFVLLLAADLVLISCYKAKTYYYRYTKAHLEVMEADLNTDRMLAGNNDSVAAEKLHMWVNLGTDLIAAAKAPQGFLLNNALAFSPRTDNYVNMSKLKSVKISALVDFNANYPAGSDITENCQFSLEYNRFKNDTLSVQQFISDFNTKIEQSNPVNEKYAPSAIFSFRFKKLPQLHKDQKLIMIIEMEDGSMIQAESLTFKVY